MNVPNSIEVWHFTAKAGVLRDGSPFEVGVALPVISEIEPCERGYHGSPSVLHALRYAPGPHLYRRELSGTIKPHGDPLDKYVASHATATLYVGDVSRLLRVFACQCTADVLHLWAAPDVVRQYLLTQDESLRAAARAAAAGDAAGNAAWDAAGDAAWAAARDAAWDAAGAAARAAARAAAGAAAGDAAGNAAWDAVGDAQSKRLEAWVEAYIQDGSIPTVVTPGEDIPA